MTNDKVVCKDLYKIFGPRPEQAYEMVRQGNSKTEIFKQTGNTVGVQDANFSVKEGEVFVVMGLSGSGKSTLVRMLNRLIDPTFGSVEIDGEDIAQMSKSELIQIRRNKMAMVFQSFALMPHQTVVENASFGLDVAGISREERFDRALKALDAVGLKANANSYPSELSGGMKQRVGLARALTNDPTVMLMDEAFSALDPLIRTEMQDELLRLQAESRRTVVFITHDLDEAMRIGDRIAVMEDGRIVQIGTPEEIVTQPADDYVSAFFKGVDVTQVFSAGDICRNDSVHVGENAAESAATVLETLRSNGQEAAVVTDQQGTFQGLASRDSLNAASQKSGTVKDAFVQDSAGIAADASLSDVLHQVAKSSAPVAVADANGKYLGAVTKSSLLQTLDRTG